MAALDRITRWPVLHAAAAVVGPAGVVEAAGDTDHVFALASVTKLLSAMATLVAVEEESVSLDDPAGPEGSTVRHLLAHASGLAFEGGPVAPPGTRRIYSNAGYDALGAHVARATGLAFSDYLTEAVFEPLAMEASALSGSPAHSAASSVADLVRFTQQLLGPSLVAPSTLHLAMTVAFPSLHGVLPGIGPQRPLDWGLGFEIATTSPRTGPRQVALREPSGTSALPAPSSGSTPTPTSGASASPTGRSTPPPCPAGAS